MQKSYLEKHNWKNLIWTKVENKNILTKNDNLNIKRFNTSLKHLKLLTS